MNDRSENQFEFDSTRWSLIEEAGGEDCSQRQRALESLLRGYMPALRAHLVYKRRLSGDVADDVLHDFVTEKILQGTLLTKADHTKGRFRSLLLKSLNNFLVDHWRKTQRKEPAARPAKSFDDLGSADPDWPRERDVDAFDVVWARTLLMSVLADMRHTFDRGDRLSIWLLFEKRILLPMLCGTSPVPYSELVEQLGFDSPERASNALITAKRNFRRALEDQVSAYVGDNEEVRAEIADLQTILANAGRLGLEWPETDDSSMKQLDEVPVKQLAQLLDLNDNACPRWRDEQLASSVEQFLSKPLRQVLQDVSPRRAAGLALLAKQDPEPIVTFADLITHRQPPIDVLQAVRIDAKKCMAGSGSTMPRSAAPIIYLAAVSAALVRHHDPITRADNSELSVTLRQALDTTWLPNIIRQLFQEALAKVA